MNGIIKTNTIILSIMIFTLAGINGCSGHRPKSGHRHPPSPQEMMQEFDTNRDGKLSREEFPGPDEHFSRFDKNGDGFLELSEMPDGPPPGMKRR